MSVNKEARNLIIGAIVTVLLSTGTVVLKHNMNKKEPEKKTGDPRIERVIVYTDGSMRFLMDFPGMEEDAYVEEREEKIDYIEIYNEDGTTEIVDYDNDKEENKVSSFPVKKKVLM